MLGFLNRKKENEGMVGVCLADHGIALAHTSRSHEGAPHLNQCELINVDSDKQRSSAFVTRVSDLGLNQTHCSFVLSNSDYNLLLVEAPKVEANEMASAIRWRIKDLLDRPLDEVATDVFPVPDDAYRNQGEMLYVVAARKSRIVEIVDLIESSGLILDAIDIPELALRNLSSMYTDDSNGLAFMDLRPTGSTLNLCKNGSIYLTRHLSTQVDADVMSSNEWESVRERLVLEIQRSLDYYESQMGQNPISRLLIAPRSKDSHALAKQLNEAMGVSVETMDLAARLDTKLELPADKQQSCLLAIGGSLRQEGHPARKERVEAEEEVEQ